MGVAPDDLAEHLGVAVDSRVERAAEAATRWAENRRSMTDPDVLWLKEDVMYGAILYGALLFQSRSAPQGFAGYEDGPSQSTEALFRARDLVGSDPVFA